MVILVYLNVLKIAKVRPFLCQKRPYNPTYVTLDMIVGRIRRVLKFKQSDWLKGFALFNTEKRMNAANEFEKAFFKLIINSVYGKPWKM